MAWIFLAASPESASLSKDGLEQSLIVSKTDTHKAYYCPECNQVTLIEPQSGQMLKPCGGGYCQESTSSPEVFHAKTSVLVALERAWQVSEAVFSLRLSDSLAKFDQSSFSWKTCQLSLFGGLTEFSWSSLRWGMIVDGQLTQPHQLEPITLENVGSFWPTPRASDWRDWNTKLTHGRHSPRTPIWFYQKYQRGLSVTILERMMGYPYQWVKLSASATQWFHSKSNKRLKS